MESTRFLLSLGLEQWDETLCREKIEEEGRRNTHWILIFQMDRLHHKFSSSALSSFGQGQKFDRFSRVH